MPEMHITIFSDQRINATCFDKFIILQSSHNGYLDKIMAMQQSPYERTLFLDTDTYICSNFSELFGLLDKYDIGIMLAEHRTGEHNGISWDYQTCQVDGSWVYPLVNSGVILYKKSSKITQLFDDWFLLAKQEMCEYGIKHGDQAAFTPILFKSDLREVILPPEYNCRFAYPIGVCGTVKILHGRDSNLPMIAKEINSYTGPRIWQPGLGLIPRTKLELIKKAWKHAKRYI